MDRRSQAPGNQREARSAGRRVDRTRQTAQLEVYELLEAEKRVEPNGSLDPALPYRKQAFRNLLFNGWYGDAHDFSQSRWRRSKADIRNVQISVRSERHRGRQRQS